MKRIPTDDNLKRMKIQLVSKCWCCEDRREKTMTHVLLTDLLAVRLWRQFAHFTGIQVENMQLHQLIVSWWTKVLHQSRI